MEHEERKQAMSALQPTDPPKETPEHSKKAKWRRLETVAEVRLAMATMIKRMYDGKLDPDVGRACIYGLRSLATVLRDSDLETRLRSLEQRLSQ